MRLWTFTTDARRPDESLGRAEEKARLAYRASRAGKQVCREPLEAVFQAKLHDAPRNRTRRDDSIRRRAGAEAVAGFVELCVIPEVEEFHPELKTPVFARPTDTGVLDDRRIKIELCAAARYSDGGVAEAGAAPDELRVVPCQARGAKAIVRAGRCAWTPAERGS